MSFKIPLCKPSIDVEETTKEIRQILKSGNLTGGEYTQKFEEEFSWYVGADHCIAMNSCASALQLSLMANLVKGGIIVPSYTFTASINSIYHSKNYPLFCDIDEDTLCIDPDSARRCSNPNVAGIMPVHLAGFDSYKLQLYELACKNGWFIIEDSAEMIKRGQEVLGTACYSFFPSKNMTTGEGGMIATNSEKIAEYCRILRSHGTVRRGLFGRDAVLPGFNFRMTEIQAAMGSIQLRSLDKMTRDRQNLANYYNKELKGFNWIKTPTCDIMDSTWQMYIIRVPAEIRNKFVEFMVEKGIECSVHFSPPVHKQTAYAHKNAKLPVTEKVCKEVVTLPMYPDLKRTEINFIIEKIEEFENEQSKNL